MPKMKIWVDQNAARSYIHIDNDGTDTNASMEYAIRMEGVLWDNSDLATLNYRRNNDCLPHYNCS